MQKNILLTPNITWINIYIISLNSKSSSISGVYTAEKPTQAQPRDSVKLASRYLDGDSNFKIEAFNHQTFDKTSK